MQFRTTATLIALLSSSANAALTADAAQAGIDLLSSQSDDAVALVNKLNPITIFTAGPQIISSFRNIISTESQLAQQQQSQKRSAQGPSGRRAAAATSYDEASQDAICEHYSTFSTVHTQLLQALIGKQPLLALTPFAAPIAAVLRVDESGIDTLSFGFVDEVPKCADDFRQNQEALDAILNQAITAYST